MPRCHIVVSPPGEPVPWSRPLPSETIFLDDFSEVAVLARGMQSGAASVAFRVDLPDGRVVVIQASQPILEGILGAARGAESRFAD